MVAGIPYDSFCSEAISWRKADSNQAGLTVGEREFKLTNTEFRLLELLARNAGQIVPNGLLLSRVWGPEARDEVDLRFLPTACGKRSSRTRAGPAIC